MRPTTSTLSRVLPALLAAVVVSIVLSILGMHALNNHGVVSNTDHANMTSLGTGSQSDMSAALAISGTVSVTTYVPTTAPSGGNGHNIRTMVMLCVAMLAAAAGALLLRTFGLRRTPRVWAHLPTAPTAVAGWVTARPWARPPPVWEFSVIRC